MRGLILAAGRGSRLGGLSADRPKCLVRLADRPLLTWQRSALAAAGVDELAVVVGYRAELVAGTGLPVFTAPRWRDTEMVSSLLTASAWLADEPCVVSYGDIVYTDAIVRRLISAAGNLAIAYDPDWLTLWRRRFADPLDDAETFRRTADGALAHIGAHPRTVAEVQGQYMGLLRFTPAAWASTRAFLDRQPAGQVDRMHMTGLLRGLLDAGGRIETVPCFEPWCEVDSAGDLAVAEDIVRESGMEFDGGQEVHS